MNVTRVRATRGFGSLRLGEVWRHREVGYLLVWRDLKVRYRQTAFGVAWALLQPLILMILFTVFLGRLAGVPSEGVPYSVFAYSGLVLWTLFAQATTGAADSLVANAALVSRVYVPRVLMPLAAGATYVVDFLISLVLLAVLMAVESVAPNARLLWAPAFALMGLAAAVGFGLFLSALNVRYRDVRYALPFMVQILLFASPVAYPASLIPENMRWLYGLNPMAGAITGWRWATVGGSLDGVMLAVSVGATFVVLAVGAAYFARTQRHFADVI